MTTGIPETRASLIVRLPNANDAPAWTEFADIYEPFVYQYARRRGLQDSDARELVQEVFLGVAKAVRRWEPDVQRAKFRTWLFRIARNQLLTLIMKRQREHVVDSSHAVSRIPDEGLVAALVALADDDKTVGRDPVGAVEAG